MWIWQLIKALPVACIGEVPGIIEDSCSPITVPWAYCTSIEFRVDMFTPEWTFICLLVRAKRWYNNNKIRVVTFVFQEVNSKAEPTGNSGSLNLRWNKQSGKGDRISFLTHPLSDRSVPSLVFGLFCIIFHSLPLVQPIEWNKNWINTYFFGSGGGERC